MISVLIQYLFKIPHVLFLLLKDLFYYIKFKRYRLFEGWGLHLFVGAFGAGKTCTMVYQAYLLAQRYPQLTILTNLKLFNFPLHTDIVQLHSAKDILEAPENTLVLIDEIGTIFNSRDFSSSKESVPKILFQHICQCRKRRLMIYATTQRWNFLDKQLRDITATVRVTRSHFSHPWTRVCTIWKYDAVDYDKAFSNPLVRPRPLNGSVYVQTDACRQRYDTAELIETMLQAEYIPDSEILENRGDAPSIIATAVDGKKARKIVKGNSKWIG